MQKEPKFLTIAQAAEFLKVSPDTLRRWEDRGIVTPHRTKGGSRRYTLLDLKIAKLNKKKTRFFQLPTLITKNYISSKRDLRIALLTSFLWIFALLLYHFLTPVFLSPTNPQQRILSDQLKDQTRLKVVSETNSNQIKSITVVVMPDQSTDKKTAPNAISQGADLLIRRVNDSPDIIYTDSAGQYYSLQPLPQNPIPTVIKRN